MPKRGDVQINSFTKGLITEVSPLSFPEGASLDELNMKLKKDGTRERRLGMDYEAGYGTKATGLSAEVLEGARMTAYRWSVANGQAHTEIGVIQVGASLYFIDLLTSAPSANYLNGGNPITGTGLDNAMIVNFATINNFLLVIGSGFTNPLLFSYDKETDTVTYDTAEIMVRDLWGVDDALGENDRPTTLSPEHHYNLKNQGWDDSVITTCGAGINAIQCTFNTFGIYPGNGDQWSIGRVEDLQSADVDKYNPNIAARNLVNTGQVARGHYILPLFFRGQSRIDQTGLLLKADQELGRLTAVASYAGRAFYSGILSKVNDGDNRSPLLSGVVFFSQTFVRKADLIKCYQEADPTNPDFNEVVDTDGGYITIPECSLINALRPIKQSLFVFAENGVWEIRGDDGGFRATSYQVNKISNIGVYSPKSIIEVNGVIYFWGNSGIYAITPNQFGTFDTNNITLQTIQRLYNSIPDSAKRNARGYHDNHTNTVRWLFYSGEEHQIGEPIEVVPPPPLVTTVGTPLQLLDAGLNATLVRIVKLENTKYVILFDQATLANIQYSVIHCNEDDFTVTATTAANLQLATLFSPNSFCAEMDANRFMFFNGHTNVRIVSVSGDTLSIGASSSLHSIIGTNLGYVGKLDNNRIVAVMSNTADSKIRIQIIDYSSGSISVGTVFTSTNTYNSGFNCYLTQAGSDWKMVLYSQDKVVIFTINPASSISEGTPLVVSSKTFVGGLRMCITELAPGFIMCGNSRQFVVVTLTDPPTLLAFEDDASGVALGVSNDVELIEIPGISRVARFMVPNSGTYGGSLVVQYLGVNVSDVVQTQSPFPLLDSISNPDVNSIRSTQLNPNIKSAAWCSILFGTGKLVTQMLRLV